MDLCLFFLFFLFRLVSCLPAGASSWLVSPRASFLVRKERARMCVCVCLFVCVREREREREIEKGGREGVSERGREEMMMAQRR